MPTGKKILFNSDNVNKIHSYLSTQGDVRVGNQESFEKYMSTPQGIDNIYNYLKGKKDVNLKGVDNFRSFLTQPVEPEPAITELATSKEDEFNPYDIGGNAKLLNDYQEATGVLPQEEADLIPREQAISTLRDIIPDYQPIDNVGVHNAPSQEDLERLFPDKNVSLGAVDSFTKFREQSSLDALKNVNESIVKSRRSDVSKAVNSAVNSTKMADSELALTPNSVFEDIINREIEERARKMGAAKAVEFKERGHLAIEQVMAKKESALNRDISKHTSFDNDVRDAIRNLEQEKSLDGLNKDDILSMAKTQVQNARTQYGFDLLSGEQKGIYNLVIERGKLVDKLKNLSKLDIPGAPGISATDREEARLKLFNLTKAIQEGVESGSELFNPVTGSFVDKEVADEETVEFNEMVDNVRIPTDKDVLISSWNKVQSKLKYIENVLVKEEIISVPGEKKKYSLHDIEDLSRRYSLPIGGDAKVKRDEYLKLHLETKAKFLALNRALLLNEDPSTIDRGFFAQMFEHGAESIVSEFTGDPFDITTSADFQTRYVQAIKETGGRLTKAQEAAAVDQLTDKIAKGAGGSMGAMLKIGLNSYTLGGLSYINKLSKIGKLVRGAAEQRFGKTGLYLYNITKNQLQGAISFGMTTNDNVRAVSGVGEGTIQGIIDSLNMENLMKGKFGKLISAVKIGRKGIGVRPAEFTIRTAAGGTGETFQEYFGELVSNLEDTGFDWAESFKETFGRTPEDVFDKAIVTTMVSAMFSSAFNMKSLFYAKSVVQAQPESAKKVETLKEINKIINQNVSEDSANKLFEEEAPAVEEVEVEEVEVEPTEEAPAEPTAEVAPVAEEVVEAEEAPAKETVSSITETPTEATRVLEDGEKVEGVIKRNEKGEVEFKSKSDKGDVVIDESQEAQDKPLSEFGLETKAVEEVAEAPLLEEGKRVMISKGFDEAIIDNTNDSVNNQIVENDLSPSDTEVVDNKIVIKEDVQQRIDKRKVKEEVVEPTAEVKEEVVDTKLTEEEVTPTEEEIVAKEAVVEPVEEVAVEPVEEVADTKLTEEEAVVEEEEIIDKEEAARLDGEIETAEINIENLQEEIKNERENLKSDVKKLQDEKKKIRASEMTKDEKDDAIEDINGQIQDLKDDTADTIDGYRDDIKSEKADLRAANRERGKLERKVVKPAKVVKTKKDYLNDIEDIRIGKKSVKTVSQLRNQIKKNTKGRDRDELLDRLELVEKARRKKIEKKKVEESGVKIKEEPIMIAMQAARRKKERRVDSTVRNIIGRLKKAFPKIEVVTERDEFLAEAKGFGFNEDTAPVGFVSPKTGKVYINPDKAEVDTAMEEFAHLWLQVAKNTRPEIYNAGLKLVEDSPYMDEVNADKNYKGTEEFKRDEALARAITDSGLKLENKNAFITWLRKFWAAIKKGLGLNPNINLAETTLQEYSDKVAKELLNELPIAGNLDSDTYSKIINNERIEGVVKVDTSILAERSGLDLLKTKFIDRELRESKGAGKELLNKKERVKFKIERHVKEAEINLKKFHKILKDYVATNEFKEQYVKDKKGKDGKPITKKEAVNNLLTDINNALTSRGAIDLLSLPKEFLSSIQTMRDHVDNLTNLLMSEGIVSTLRDAEGNVIGQDIEAILTNNLGQYLTRSYKKHDIVDWPEVYKEHLSEDELNKAVSFLKDKYGVSNIKGIKFEKDSDGNVYYRFINSRGLESIAEANLDLKEFAGIISEEDIKLIQDAVKNQESGEINFENKTEEQDIVKFELTTDGVNGLIQKLLTKGATTKIAKGAKLDVPGVGKLEAGILKKKDQNLDGVIRMLYGEYTDPDVNYVKTITKMAALAEKSKFEKDLLAGGEGIFISKTKKPEGGMTVEIKESESKGLAGRYTTPEIHNLLFATDEIFMGSLMEQVNLLNALTKASLTIFKDDSQARNFWGAIANLMSTGHMPTGYLEAIKTATINAKKGDKTAMAILSSPLFFVNVLSEALGENRTQSQIEEDYLDAIEHGLLDDSVSAGIIEDLLNRTKEVKSKGVLSATKSGLKEVTAKASRVYQLSDSLPKLVQWKKEIRDLTKAFPGKDKKEIKRMAAEKVRLMQPTYSKAANILKRLSRSPIIGSFVMFQVQMYRTRFAILKEANKEMKQGIKENNKQLMRMALKRYVGMGVMSIATPVLAAVARGLTGWSDEDDAYLSRFFPFYSENNTRIMFGEDKLHPAYFDMTFMDPSSFLHKPVVAAIRGEDLEDKFTGFFSEAIGPFTSAEIFVGQLNEVVNNMDEYKRNVTNPNLPGWERSVEKLLHATEVLVPGVLKTAFNITLGSLDAYTNYGKVYNFWDEVMNSRIGTKKKTIDVPKKVKGTMKGRYNDITETTKIYKEALDNQLLKSTFPSVYKWNVDRKFRQTEEKVREHYNNLKLDYEAAKALGLSRMELQRLIVSDAKMPQKLFDNISVYEFSGIDKEGNLKLK